MGMPQKLITVAAWALLAFIVYATISPIQDRPTLLTSVSLERFGAFLVLGALFCLAYPRQATLACLIVIGSAVPLEFAQLLTVDRHGRVRDAIETMGGGAVGIVARKAILRFERTRQWFSRGNN